MSLKDWSDIIGRQAAERRERQAAGRKVIEDVEKAEPFSPKVLEVMDLIDRWNQITLSLTQTQGIEEEESDSISRDLIELRKKINSLVG